MNPPLPEKKDVATALLEKTNIRVCLDPRVEGVALPPWLLRQPEVVLHIGLNMAIPIPDLIIGDEKLSCTLSFNRSPFWCVIPWKAVYAIVGDDLWQMVWPDDLPKELRGGASSNPQKGAPKAAPPLDADGAKRPKKKNTKVPRLPARLREAPVVDEGVAALPPPEEFVAPDAAGAEVGNAPETGRSSPKQPGRKPKRELPPYLRVIK